ncbi:unnamed protein product [Prorocentrum cordatum]|uniref:Guanine nucleotide-binding protein subunit beta-like protein n=1 Tax=Prorocentrum cordatum TaxID=2364126 RepID=A0ABN9X4D4_9DINO|nr:unnamed protein product [Polarella glacialis]
MQKQLGLMRTETPTKSEINASLQRESDLAIIICRSKAMVSRSNVPDRLQEWLAAASCSNDDFDIIGEPASKKFTLQFKSASGYASREVSQCLPQPTNGPNRRRRFSGWDAFSQAVEVHASVDKSLYQVKFELLLKQLRRTTNGLHPIAELFADEARGEIAHRWKQLLRVIPNAGADHKVEWALANLREFGMDKNLIAENIQQHPANPQLTEWSLQSFLPAAVWITAIFGSADMYDMERDLPHVVGNALKSLVELESDDFTRFDAAHRALCKRGRDLVNRFVLTRLIDREFRVFPTFDSSVSLKDPVRFIQLSSDIRATRRIGRGPGDAASLVRAPRSTRPLGVKNADSREIAAACARELAKALLRRVDPMQRGFTPTLNLAHGAHEPSDARVAEFAPELQTRARARLERELPSWARLSSAPHRTYLGRELGPGIARQLREDLIADTCVSSQGTEEVEPCRLIQSSGRPGSTVTVPRSIDLLNLTSDSDIDVLINQIVFEEPLISEGKKETLRKMLYKLLDKIENKEQQRFYLFKILRAHILPLTNCAFNKSGSKFITGSYDRTCRVWDTLSGDELLTLDGHKNVVYAIAFNNPFGDKIVTGPLFSLCRATANVVPFLVMLFSLRGGTMMSPILSHVLLSVLQDCAEQ